MKKGIVLIGMAGAGKSTVGKLLAKKLKWKFIDADKYIEKREGIKLQKIIDEKGEESFVKIEEKRILELLPLKNIVLAPGGSVVYANKLMRTLKNHSLIVWLNTPFFIIKKRLSDSRTRGIIGIKTKSLKRVFQERKPLYQKYADIAVNRGGKSCAQIAKTIKLNLRQRRNFTTCST